MTTVTAVTRTRARNWQNVVIVALIMILIVGPAFATIPNYLVDRFDRNTATFWQMSSFFVTLLFALAVTIVLIRARRIDWRGIGLFAPTPWYAVVIAVITGLFWAYSSTFYLRGVDPDADILSMWLTISPLRVFLVVVGPIGAWIEDFITRGFIMNELKEARVPSWLQLLFSGLLFALYHSVWMVPIIGVYFLYSFAASFGYGLLLGGLYLIGKRSLTPVMISHGLTVLIGEPILTYMLIQTFVI